MQKALPRLDHQAALAARGLTVAELPKDLGGSQGSLFRRKTLGFRV